jgi:saccharopine dehydrogenase-like NADP-dependent oxidoreductase
MTRAIVLGAGMVGSVMATDLAGDDGFEVTIADARQDALEAAVARARRQGRTLRPVRADLSEAATLAATIEPFDVVLGALASRIGFASLRTIIEAGKNYCDISFMPEDAIDLDALARERGVTAVVDCGVAPGMSNLVSGYGASLLDEPEEIEIYVGGLPRERRWPFEYKAGFAPADVIEEYTRPSRIVEGGRVVVREALSEPELLDFAGIGTLEAFNTDGLRSLATTMSVPNMKEKTLRYPGHIELMRVFRATGLFGHEPIDAGGVRVRPIDVISRLMFPKWAYEEGEEDLTVMRVAVTGTAGGRRVRHAWDLLDFFDKATGATSMSRTTAFPCAIMARLVASGRFDRRGVFPPERFADDAEIVRHMLEENARRGVVYTHRAEDLGAV